jgi:cell wall-associated NlpC family hydrolase
MPSYTFSTLGNPRRILVKKNSGVGVIAVFTFGCHTVRFRGPLRTFTETTDVGNLSVSVAHRTWVRCLTAPFTGTVDVAWLDAALLANQSRIPDILSLSMQYIGGAPILQNAAGDKIAGDADYGPFDGLSRLEGSDFNDYLGVSWEYESGDEDLPEISQLNCLDCSGFVRMVYGFRDSFESQNGKVPLSLDIQSDCSTIARRAWQICIGAPGLLIIPNQGVQVTSFATIKPGDLVFFDTNEDDGPAIDHVGIYLGVDTDGDNRFVSSRKTINGPTFQDIGGPSLLNGAGLYARSFRAVRRV